MIFDETLQLANGVHIPVFGLGTWFIEDKDAADAVRAAAQIGYRLFDTAQAYGNEAGVGEGIRTCGISRDKLFVTSKVAAEHKDYQSAKASIDATLEKMGLDYLDLMIIHSPQPWKVVNQSENRYFAENVEVWKALEDAYLAGKLRAIGVSNFLQEDLDNIIKHCGTKPMVDQVLCHVGHTPAALLDYCKTQGIQVEAYAPIAHGAAMNIGAVQEISHKYNVTVPQLCLRYDLQLGTVVLPKTANPDHMKSNAAVDFTISDADMETLKNVHYDDYGAVGKFPVFGGKYKG